MYFRVAVFVRALLHQYCPQAERSMILTVNFMKFSYAQLHQAHQSPFLLNIAKPDPKIHLKHMVVKSLIKISRDFSCSVYKRIDKPDAKNEVHPDDAKNQDDEGFCLATLNEALAVLSRSF